MPHYSNFPSLHIHTFFVQFHTEEELNILKNELERCFPYHKLQHLDFYMSVVLRRPYPTHKGTEDNVLVNMIHKHRLQCKVMRLRALLKLYYDGKKLYHLSFDEVKKILACTVDDTTGSSEEGSSNESTAISSRSSESDGPDNDECLTRNTHPIKSPPKVAASNPFGGYLETVPQYNRVAYMQEAVLLVPAHPPPANPLPVSQDTANILKSLKTVIPDIDNHRLPATLLDQITKLRLSQFDEYIKNLDSTRHSHPRLKDDSTFESLTCQLRPANASTTLFTIDIEAYEFDNTKVTEVGISIHDPLKNGISIHPQFTTIHLLVKEHIHLRNGAYVADNKDHFLCGSSIVLPQLEIVDFVQCLIDYYFIERISQGFKSVIVGHSLKDDIKWIQALGIKLPKNIAGVDTQAIFRLTHGDTGCSLGGVLNRFEIPHAYLHNAGNDAYFTLILLLKLSDVVFRKKKGIDDWKMFMRHVQMESDRYLKPSVDFFSWSQPSQPLKTLKRHEFSEPLEFEQSSEALKHVLSP